MALLLAQPQHVTPMWVGLTEAINRWLWRWSPWHLRAKLEAFRMQTGDRFMNFGPVLKWSYAEDEYRELLSRGNDAEFEKFIDRAAAQELAAELLKSGSILKRTYRHEVMNTKVREYSIQTARAVYPC